MITHNDSGGKEILYEFSLEGKIVKEYKIEGCGKNNDWEDLAADDNYYYILLKISKEKI